MSFEPQRWTNSLAADSYFMGIGVVDSPPARIDLTNFYQWQIRLVDSVITAGQPMMVTFCFEDPLVNTGCARFTVAILDPTLVPSYTAGSLLLSSEGVNWPTNQATIWVYCDAPDVGVMVWGSRRV